jgi:hypothetical protein
MVAQQGVLRRRTGEIRGKKMWVMYKKRRR